MPSMHRKQGSYVRSLCKMAVSLLLIAWIISRMDLTKAWNLIVDFNVTYLEPILALMVIGIFICVWKWSLLLRATGSRYSFVVLLRLFWIGLFFSNFLPGRAGGDLVRAYGIAKHAQNRTAATLSVIVDRCFSFLALLAIALLAGFLGHSRFFADIPLRSVLYPGLASIAIIAFSSLVSVRLFIRKWPWVKQFLIEVKATVSSLLSRPVLLTSAAALSLLYQVSIILSNYGAASGLGLDVPIAAFFFLIPFTALITMIPISLNGFGLREAAYVFAFSSIGIPEEAALALSVVPALCMIGTSLIGGIFYVLSPDWAGVPSEHAEEVFSPATPIAFEEEGA